jgi:hypothetical protein
MNAHNQPTVLVIAAPTEGDSETAETMLERHIEALAGFACRRFVVVAAEDAKPGLERLRDTHSIQLRSVPAPESLAAAFVAAEPPLAHFATGPVLLTQPAYGVDASLYRDILDAWAERPSGVEGIIATAEAREPRGQNMRLLLQGERLTRSLIDDDSPGGGEVREYVGAMTYSWSRELCETIGEEADRHGHRDAVALGLNRLMAWNDVRNFPYAGPWRRDDTSSPRREPRLAGTPRLQRPYSPR